MPREMNRLSLALLGTPDVRQDRQLVAFATRKALALLVYLSIEGGRHSREKITDLFWPETDSTHGRATLRRTLVLLRRALLNPDAYLLIERDHLSFNPQSAYDLDLHMLDAAVRLGPAREALPQLQAAIEAYRGDFLDGFSLPDAPGFDDWSGLQREHWHRQIEQVFDWVSQLHAESGATGPAIEMAARWVAHAPLNEAAHRRLMMACFIAGNRTSALQAYQTCRTLLQAELGVEPEPATEALAERIRAEARPQRFAANQPAGGAGPAMLEGPLVGRAAEFGQLVGAYQAAAQAQPRVVTLEGEGGIGKTRLALEFLSWARAQGAHVLYGRAFEASDRVPYQPLVDALRQSNLLRDPAVLSPAWLAELVPLLPELREALPDVRPASTEADPIARTRLLEAVARLTQALAETAPLILFLDDAHWADVATLDVVRYAVRAWSAHATPAMLLLTLPNESLAGPLGEWIPAVARETHTARHVLHALTADDTQQLVEALAARSATSDLESFSQWLHAETGGQPFFITETLKTLVERGLLVGHQAAAGKWILRFPATGRAADLQRAAHMPLGVQVLIRTRLARLTPPGLALLTAGAVIGRDFEFEMLRVVAGLTEDEGLAAVDELRGSQLIREGQNESWPERLAIAHDKIRDVVYADAGQARRRVFHRRTLEALEAAASPAGQLAHHALAAGLTEAAFGYSLAAGDDALRVFAVRVAIRHYELARTLSAEIHVPIAQLESLCLQLGRAYELESEFDNARAVYEALLAAARLVQQPQSICIALNRLATLAVQAAMDFELALAHLREALRVAAQIGATAALAETEWNLAQIGYYMGNANSVPNGERALALARELGQPELLARSLNVLAWAKADFTGDWPQSVAYAQEARELYRSLGNRAMEADCLCLLANAELYLGQPQVAIDMARVAHAISLEIDNPWGQAHSAFQVAKCALDVGAYAEALTYAEQGATLALARNLPMLSLLCLALQGAVQRTLGMLDRARETHHAAREQLAKHPALIHDLAAMISVELIADQALAGDWESASIEAQGLQPATSDRTLSYNMLLSLGLLVETLLHMGDAEAAARLVQHFGEHVGGSSRARMAHLRARAILDQWRGESEQAIAQLQAAAALAEAIGLPGEQWQIQAALGDLYHAQGDQDAAQASHIQGYEIVCVLANGLDERLRKGFLATKPVQRLLPKAQ
jgi:DNA-binding SARP family transcriptional activator